MLADHRVDHRVAAAMAVEWRQGGGRVAADSWSAKRQHKHCPPTHKGGGGGVCVEVSASVALLTTLTPANSQPFPHIHAPEYARHTHRHHRCIPFHADMATTGQCLTRAWHAGRPQGGPQGGGSVAAEWRQRGGSVAADSWSAPRRYEHCPPTHWGGGGVCVVVSASVALLTTLTPANSQPLHLTFTRPNTHATHLPPPLHPISCRHGHHRAVSNKGWACWPTTGWRQRGGSVAAAWRQTAFRLRGSTNTAHQHTGVVVCVCVWWSQPLWLSSPHSLPPTPNHFLTFTRPNTHATHLPPPLHPILCRHGHHRAVSNKGWACWPTTGWRQVGG